MHIFPNPVTNYCPLCSIFGKLFYCSVDQNTRLIFSLEIFLDSNEEMIKVGDHMILFALHHQLFM